MAVATLIGTSLILPITRQFFLPFMPIAAYLIWFYSARYVSIKTFVGSDTDQFQIHS